MSQRPEVLFPLFARIDSLPGIGPKGIRHYEKIGLRKPRDLMFHLPHSVIDRTPRETILGVVLPATITVQVQVRTHRPNAVKGGAYRVMVEDAKITFPLVFFHANRDWLERKLPAGAQRVVSGRVELFDTVSQMVHPDHIVLPSEAGTIPRFEAVYPLGAGITRKAMTKATAAAVALLPDLTEWIAPAILAKYRWPAWTAAITRAHAPKGGDDLHSGTPARQRLAYDELLAHQLTVALARAHRRRHKGISTAGDGRLRNRVLAALPYRPTGAQMRSVEEITHDMEADTRMNRLLQGDVGSGKTLVAFLVLLAAVEAGGQGVLMAPTEILARQHLDVLQPLAEDAGVVLEILTGRDRGAERRDKLEALQRGAIQVLVGTHSVFQKDVDFADLRLAVIDEQHRFGVAERLRLGEKGAAADILVMTATPIPRSLQLTHYGNMDISLLDEKPPGRKPVDTVLVSQARLKEVVERLKAAVAEGRQAYWVCPLVDESERRDWAAASDRARALRLALGERAVGLVHGQMPPMEKNAAMAQFVAGATAVLVATTVIEVGVNVPNASIMVVEQAETFGLAQLHQLRGRVGRGEAASTCLLLYGALTRSAEKRLKALRDTDDGFKIAEADLNLRGAGDVLGVAQSGLPHFRIADLAVQTDLMQIAREDARRLLCEDPGLTTDRGKAARTLLWLMEQEKAFRYMSVG
ncbi:MAG: ATP-dependent DNA helicase RecG [Rhodobacteraceae bacterium]|nr:ATP-dependent DNA helicase RecG [Paracoccaceae bacterium]